MADMLIMPAGQLRHPMALLIFVIAGYWLLHSNACKLLLLYLSPGTVGQLAFLSSGIMLLVSSIFHKPHISA
ncbi:MAG: hypothetical protein ACTMHG_03665 [Marinobacter sp.]